MNAFHWFEFLLTAVQAKIVRSPVNPETFLNILEKTEVFKEEMMDSLLREIEENEFQRKQVSSAKLDTVRIFLKWNT